MILKNSEPESLKTSSPYILLDCCGVLSEKFFDPYTADTHALLESWGEMPDLDSYRQFMKKFERPYLRGEVEPDEFWHGVMQRFTVNPTPKRISEMRDVFTGAFEWQEEVMEMVRHSLDHLVIGVLSNTYQEIKPLINDQGDMFDFIVLSCDEGVCKPDPRIYRSAYEGFRERVPDIQPRDITYIDDKVKNVRGAREFGMVSHQFQTPSTLRRVIKETLQVV